MKSITLRFRLNLRRSKPPGSLYNLAISYHEGALPVCAKCKKIYKSRKVCRAQLGHTDPPWTPAYVCITLDDSCIDQRITCENDSASTGKIHLVDLPLEVKAPSTRTNQFILDSSSVKSWMSSCLKCKRSKLSKVECRTQNKHTSLPWNTVFATVGRAKSSQQRSIQRQLPLATRDVAISQESDDIRNIQPSLTFLIAVSCLSISLQWLSLNPRCAAKSPDAIPAGSVAMISHFTKPQQQQVESRPQPSLNVPLTSDTLHNNDEHNGRLGIYNTLPQGHTQLQRPLSPFLSPESFNRNILPNVVLTLPRNDYEVMNRSSSHNNMNNSWARQFAIDPLSRRLIQQNPLVQGHLVPNQESSLIFTNEMAGTGNYVLNPDSISAMQQLQRHQRSADLQDLHQYRTLLDQQQTVCSLHQQLRPDKYFCQIVPTPQSSLIVPQDMVGARLVHHVPTFDASLQQLQQQQRSLDSTIANLQNQHRTLQDQQQTLYSLPKQYSLQPAQNAVAPRYIGKLVPSQHPPLFIPSEMVGARNVPHVSNPDLLSAMQQLQHERKSLDNRIGNLQDQFRNLQDQQPTLFLPPLQHFLQPSQSFLAPVSNMARTSLDPLIKPPVLSRQAQTVPAFLVPVTMEPVVAQENPSARLQRLQDVIEMQRTHRMQAFTEMYNVDDDDKHIQPSKRFKSKGLNCNYTVD